MKLTRRRLLQGGLALGGLSAIGLPALGGFGHTPAFANPRDDLYFIFAYFSGGWDVLLTLDPRDPRVFRDDRKKVTRIQPAYDKLTSGQDDLVRTAVDGMVFGPHIGGLADVADKLTVVRGLSMDTLTHEVGRRRFLTGQPPAGLQAQGSSLATVLAAELGPTEPIPQLSVRVESYNDGMPAFASAIRVNSVDDLLRALRPSPSALPAGEQEAVEALLATARECDRIRTSTFQSQALDFRQAARDLVALGLDARFDFSASTAEMEALRDVYGIDPYDLAGAPAQAAAAVTALTSGISRCVSFEVAKDLDAHGPEWAASHGPRLESGFDIMAALIRDLERREYKDSGGSWLDHTVVVGFSEFARTPMLNSSGGRDHHLLNACVMAGGGLPGGRVLGASSDAGMAPQRLDYQTGVVSPGGQIVRPENLFAALQEHAGIAGDPGGLEATPFRALLG